MCFKLHFIRTQSQTLEMKKQGIAFGLLKKNSGAKHSARATAEGNNCGLSGGR